MKKIAFFLLAACLIGGTHGQVLTEWKDPTVPAVSKDYPATDFMSYTSRAAAEVNNYTASAYYRSLNGIWKHKRLSAAKNLDEEVLSSAGGVSDWADMEIPMKKGTWTASGKPAGIPQNTAVDLFRTEFHMPFAWADKQLFIEVQQAVSGITVFVNGKKAGYAEDACSPAVFDITSMTREGNNTLVIAATEWSTGAQLEDTNTEPSGLYGNVSIKTPPKVRVRDFEILTEMTEDYRNGVLDFGVIVKSHFLNEKTVNVYFELFSPQGELIKSDKKPVTLAMRGEEKVHFDVLIPEVQPWSAQEPVLYRVMTRIQYEGRYVEYIERKIGFRKVEYAADGIRINGEPLVLNGVNLTRFPADYSGLTGLLESLKEKNINAVRLAHSPLSGLFYELCDREGIYVLSEANIDSRSHGLTLDKTLGNNPVYLNAHLDRVQSMYERTRNYPSVIGFSLGDQAGNGYNFYEAYLWMKSREKMRPVVYRGAGREWNTDMIVSDRFDPQTLAAEEQTDAPRHYIIIDENAFPDTEENRSGFRGRL